MKDLIHTHFDHEPSFYDYPGPVIFMMALDICNALQSYDIDGDQKKLDELKLESYPGEDVTACTMYAQKQFHSGSKLLLKFCNTECEQFNQKMYAKLDMVKAFENKFKLADPKSITIATDCRTLGPIALIVWLQIEHTELATDHEWPVLATKLPQSNNTMSLHGNEKQEDEYVLKVPHRSAHFTQLSSEDGQE
jgi:hypothetical protein